MCPRSHHTQQEVLGEAVGGLTMDRAHTMPLLSRQIESTAFQAEPYSVRVMDERW